MQQLSSGRDIVLAVGVGERSVVADAMKAGGQHVQQEAAPEQARQNPHGKEEPRLARHPPVPGGGKVNTTW